MDKSEFCDARGGRIVRTLLLFAVLFLQVGVIEASECPCGQESGEYVDTSATCSINVVVPRQDAVVIINNRTTTSSGIQRSFKSVGLSQQYSYRYVIAVRYGNIVQVKEISIRAGQTKTIEFK